MYTPLPAAAKPVRVLFLSRSESSVRTDVHSLRALGMKEAIHRADTESAISFLKKERERRSGVERSSGKHDPGNAVDLVVCDELLQDGPASVFLYALAREGGMRSQPVLVLAGSPASARALRAAAVYVLERPCSMEELERMVRKAMSPMRRLLRRELFESAAATRNLPILPKKKRMPESGADGASGRDSEPTTVAGWYRKAVAHLRENELPEAERAFLRVIDGQEDHTEASLGLARVHRARGNEKGMRRYLLKAAVSCLRQGETERAQLIAKQLSEHVRADIYANEAAACLEEGRYRPAAISFLDAAGENPDKPLHRIVSRACLLTSRPDESMEKICNAFADMGNTATAAALRKRLLGYTPLEKEDRAAWLGRFPLLREAFRVASYTAWAWKRA